MHRRQFLRRGGVGASLLALSTSWPTSGQPERQGGPPNPSGWTLSFEEPFESNSLDSERWDIGWGWGRNTSISDTQITEANVIVRDGRLRLRGIHDGSDILSGGINSKNKVTFGPGSYLEARIKFADREGFHNAFWAKPNSEAWPPEIDVVEQWHSDETSEPTRTSRHHLHYSSSGEVGDDSTHVNVGTGYEPGDDITENFHVYGVEWRTDRIVHYVDGDRVRSWTDETMLDTMAEGAPFYMMLNLNINSVGTANTDDQWGEEMIVDWVRLWDAKSPRAVSSYLWVRSTEDRPAQFAFRASGGNVRLDQEDTSVDYWVSSNATTAGGTALRTDSLPGFWFDGEVVDFAYEGPIEVFIDNELVDPDSLVDDSIPGPPLVDT